MSEPPSAIPFGNTNTAVDHLLDPYFPQRSGDLLYQLFEDETQSLLAAILMEMQIENRGDAGFPTEDRPDQQEANYFVTEAPLAVDTHDESEGILNWGFPATQVTLWGFDQPIYVSFRQSGDNRKIPLEEENAPFTVAPEGGLDASAMSVRKRSEDDDDTQILVMAMD